MSVARDRNNPGLRAERQPIRYLTEYLHLSVQELLPELPS
jgi:hypothetical protein